MTQPACRLLSDEPIARALDALIAQPHHAPHIDSVRQALTTDGDAVRHQVATSTAAQDPNAIARAHRYAEAVHNLYLELDRLPKPAIAVLPTLFAPYLAARQGLLAAFGVRTKTTKANGGQPIWNDVPEPAAPAPSVTLTKEQGTPSIDIWLRDTSGWHWVAKDCPSMHEAITILADARAKLTIGDVLEVRITTSTDQAPDQATPLST